MTSRERPSSMTSLALPGVGTYQQGDARGGVREAGPGRRRATARVFAGTSVWRRTACRFERRELWGLVGRPHPERVGEWNWAVLDLAASVCLPKIPRCAECPSAACAWSQARVIMSADRASVRRRITRCDSSPTESLGGGGVANGDARRGARTGSSSSSQASAGSAGACEPLGLADVWANQWEPSTKTQHAADCYGGTRQDGIAGQRGHQPRVASTDECPSTICWSAVSPVRTTRSPRP